MRWYSIVSLFLNSRVRFLFGFIVVAIVVAIILIFVEILLRRKKIRLAEKAVDEVPVDKMRKFLKGDKTPKDKLDFVDKTAKVYFKRVYGTPVSAGYSMLIEHLEKNKRDKEVAFCRAMFVSYYSNRELTDNRAMALGSLFVDIVNKKRRLEEVSRLPSVFERVGRFLSRRRKVTKKKSKDDKKRLAVAREKVEKRNMAQLRVENKKKEAKEV